MTLFTNVGDLRYEGLEGELQWAVTRWFNLSGSLYNETTSFVPSHTDVSASASYAYNNYKVTVFGRNLTGWRHETPTFIAPLFASSTWGPGANWGVELAAKF